MATVTFPFLDLPRELQVEVIGAIDDVFTLRSLLQVSQVTRSAGYGITFCSMKDGAKFFKGIDTKHCRTATIEQLSDLVSCVKAEEDPSVYVLDGYRDHYNHTFIHQWLPKLSVLNGRKVFMAMTHTTFTPGSDVCSCSISGVVHDCSELEFRCIFINTTCPGAIMNIDAELQLNKSISFGDVKLVKWGDMDENALTVDPDDYMFCAGVIEKLEFTSLHPISGEYTPYLNQCKSFEVKAFMMDFERIYAHTSKGEADSFPEHILVFSEITLTDISFDKLDKTLHVEGCKRLENVVLPLADKEIDVFISMYPETEMDIEDWIAPVIDQFSGVSITSLSITSYGFFPKFTNVSLPNIKELTLNGCSLTGADFFSALDISTFSDMITVLSTITKLTLQRHAITLLEHESVMWALRENLHTLELSHWFPDWAKGKLNMITHRFLPKSGVYIYLPHLHTLRVDAQHQDPVELLSQFNWTNLPNKWMLDTLEVSTSLGVVSNLALLARIGFTYVRKLSIKKSVEDDFNAVVSGGLFFQDSKEYHATFLRLEELELFTPLRFEDLFPSEPVMPGLMKMKLLCELSEIDKRRLLKIDEDVMTIPTHCFPRLIDLFVGVTVGSRSHKTGKEWGIDREVDASSHFQLKLTGSKYLKNLDLVGDIKELVLAGEYPILDFVDATLGINSSKIEGSSQTSMHCPLELISSDFELRLKRLKLGISTEKPIEIKNVRLA